MSGESVARRHAARIAREDARMPEAMRAVLSPAPLPLVGPTRLEALRRLSAPSAGATPKPRGAQGEPAPEATRDRLRALFQAEGETAVVRRLGIDRGTLIRVIAGLPVRRGTVALVEEALKKEPRP